MQSAQDIQQHRLGLLPRTTPMLALLKTKSPNRGRMGLRVWWARTDLNRGPKDYENINSRKCRVFTGS